MKKKSAAILTALFLMAHLGSPVTWAESLEEKKAELDEVQRQIESNEAKRDANQKQISNAVERLVQAQHELAAAKQELAVVEGQQRILEGQIRANERALAIKQKEFDNTREIYKKRLRDIYENGQVNYLDVLLGSTDFRDFSSRMYLLQRIIRRDTRLIDTLTRQRQELADKKAGLDQQKVQLDAMHGQVLQKQELVAQKTAEQQRL